VAVAMAVTVSATVAAGGDACHVVAGGVVCVQKTWT
jgi:hypothetical protein